MKFRPLFPPWPEFFFEISGWSLARGQVLHAVFLAVYGDAEFGIRIFLLCRAACFTLVKRFVR